MLAPRLHHAFAKPCLHAGSSHHASKACAMRGAVITVAGHKGGVGKTTIAYELAAALSGVLVDLDFHGGGATNLWGFDSRHARRAPLLDALEGGGVPRPRTRANRPPLVPSHPDLTAAQLDADEIADALERWATAWAPRPIVVDTHPGAHATTDGAVQAADLVIVPVPPSRRAIAAVRDMLYDHSEFRIVLVPNMVARSPREWWLQALEAFADDPLVHLAPPISLHPWLNDRLLTTPVVSQTRPGRRTEQAAAQFRAVAHHIAQLCQTTAVS